VSILTAVHLTALPIVPILLASTAATDLAT
jgi:hypothetical protein